MEEDLRNRIERVEAKNIELEERIEESERMGMLDLILLHPLKHAMKPGVKHKLEAVNGLAGRGAIIYGAYRAFTWGAGRLAG